MIKDKLMTALKDAAAMYNGGMSANKSVATAADKADFNEKQAERLVEMFNTAAVLNKEKDSEDPAGTCELASKDAVCKILMDGCACQKSASAIDVDLEYGFYGTNPHKTNKTIESRDSGLKSMTKAASSADEVPDELKVSQRSLYKIINGQIDMLKSAAAAADDVARNMRLESDRMASEVARRLDGPFADESAVDMFKAACCHGNAVGLISEYSPRLANSDGGEFSRRHVFDGSAVEDLVKMAGEIEDMLSGIPEYEKRRDFYLSKAAEAEREMMDAVGITRPEERPASLADMFVPGMCEKSAGSDCAGEADVPASRKTSYMEKLSAGLTLSMGPALVPKLDMAQRTMSAGGEGVDDEDRRVMNIRRAMLLEDLMTNDPIIRDADPNVVAEIYKTMVMSAPRVSLDKAQVRAVLRSAVNSVAVSPNDVKVMSDVDWGISKANNLDRLTALDSSIKDSNL